jgi:ABC-type dipeptide/oligopeptide/nickel transport system permease subunit
MVSGSLLQQNGGAGAKFCPPAGTDNFSNNLADRIVYGVSQSIMLDQGEFIKINI